MLLTGEYGEMGMYLFAKVLYKSRNLCGNFCKAKSPTYEAVCIYTLTGFSVPLFSNTHSPPLCKGDDINRPPSSIRPSARKCSPSIDMAPSSREYGNVRRCVIDRTVRLLLTREVGLRKANS